MDNWMETYTWEGDTPYTLLILPAGEEFSSVYVDLDKRGWATEHADLMRTKAHWHLIRKDQRFVGLTMLVNEGDQPYYTARHIGVAGSGGSNEVTAYGIGKKLPDGTMVRLWQLPNGEVVGGDDVDEYGILFVKALGPR